MARNAGPGEGGNLDELDDLDDLDEDQDFDRSEYDTMMELEQFESLEEEMTELGVTSLDDVRRRIAELHRKLDEEKR